MPPGTHTTDLAHRGSGLLLHVTSLPGRHGSGDLSHEAHRFIDFLASAGQRWWQILPVTPPEGPPGNSPYSSRSAFAGSPYLIDLDALVADGLLEPSDTEPAADMSDTFVHFHTVRRYREQRLRRAYENHHTNGRPFQDEFEQYCGDQAEWLDDDSLFCALKDRLHHQPWWQWDRGLAMRRGPVLREARRELAREIDYHRFVQFLFDRQWQSLREYARRCGVGLIGDLPMFVAHDSAAVWSHRDLFQLDRNGHARCITGYPPDIFNKAGQCWGHPQYDWILHERTGFAWWIHRLKDMFRRFDAVRLDHFLGFTRAWSIPASTASAADGHWVTVPGRELFTAVRKTLGQRPFIAEDIGEITPEAADLRDTFGLAGMRILPFGFGKAADSAHHLPHNFERNCVAYTGTHDCETIVGWFRAMRKRRDRERVLDYVGGSAKRVHWSFIRAAMQSVANTVIIPMQDLLGLDNRARMNVPGTVGDNWRWRVSPKATKASLAQALKTVATLYERTISPR